MPENDNELRDQLHQQAAEYAEQVADAQTDPQKRLFHRQVAAHITRQISAAPREHYYGIAAVGAWFGVSAKTVTKWLQRYDDYPCPDVVIGGGGARETPGWDPAREQEWRDWYAARPGQGWRKQRP